MINRTRKTLLILLTIFSALKASAQSTTSSPYSKFGLGDLQEQALPQNMGMGGIAAGVRTVGGYNNINMLNPASYSAIGLTTIDIGAYATVNTLSNSSAKQTGADFRLNHLAFAIPVTKGTSALSFGLLPYSDLGYNFKQVTKIDTNTVNSVYGGEGGLSKAYFGYGFNLFKHLNLGFNVSYIFGNLRQTSSVEIPDYYVSSFNTRIEKSQSIKGLNYDYGLQYEIGLSTTSRVVLGYSGSLKSTITSSTKYVSTQYLIDPSSGSESTAADTTYLRQGSNVKVVLPLIQHFGISYQKDYHYLIGVDYSRGNWSQLTIDGVNQGLNNTESYHIGGQITPNPNALNSYLAVMDYRLGYQYNKTYVRTSGTDINESVFSFGLGLPIRSQNRSAFYKVNFATEFGQRGTLANNLIKENFVNFRLSFLLNDRWFNKFKFD
ncbi:hypothetical protein [Mucilaginibacter arboris]|uniref:Long-chain fatty acid transport protein n=1 Tax=Mucilaginibacter arboris TaxID=2682090 RepID=A0A7K1SRY3_9SPHI|nr:hypothetical protein [Mucilaginibacter arboris]MVN19987.1 hypothetical protein [Mucilaginibacter arboris]